MGAKLYALDINEGKLQPSFHCQAPRQQLCGWAMGTLECIDTRGVAVCFSGNVCNTQEFQNIVKMRVHIFSIILSEFVPFQLHKTPLFINPLKGDIAISVTSICCMWYWEHFLLMYNRCMCLPIGMCEYMLVSNFGRDDPLKNYMLPTCSPKENMFFFAV